MAEEIYNAFMGDTNPGAVTIAQDPVKILLVGVLIIAGIVTLGWIFKK